MQNFNSEKKLLQHRGIFRRISQKILSIEKIKIKKKKTTTTKGWWFCYKKILKLTYWISMNNQEFKCHCKLYWSIENITFVLISFEINYEDNGMEIYVKILAAPTLEKRKKISINWSLFHEQFLLCWIEHSK